MQARPVQLKTRVPLEVIVVGALADQCFAPLVFLGLLHCSLMQRALVSALLVIGAALAV